MLGYAFLKLPYAVRWRVSTALRSRDYQGHDCDGLPSASSPVILLDREQHNLDAGGSHSGLKKCQYGFS